MTARARIEETLIRRGRVECSHCMGVGSIAGLVQGWGPTVDERCPLCKGKGWVHAHTAPENDPHLLRSELDACKHRIGDLTRALRAIADWQSRWAAGCVTIARRALGQ